MVYINELNERLEKYNLKVSDTDYFNRNFNNVKNS